MCQPRSEPPPYKDVARRVFLVERQDDLSSPPPLKGPMDLQPSGGSLALFCSR
jgi:hypothetical protein